MSANIYWSPVAKGKDLRVSTASSFIENLRSAFGELPLELRPINLPVLQGMRAVDRVNTTVYDELVDAINAHGAIRIWAEW